MDRNLDRRVEAVTPVEDAEARARLASIIDVMLADDRRSWQLQPDASWVRTETLLGRAGTVDTFEVLKEDALAAAQRGGRPAPTGRRARARWTHAHEPGRSSATSRSSSSTGSSTWPPPSATSSPSRSGRSSGPPRPALVADRGPLRRHRRRRLGAGGVRGPAPPERSGDGRLGQVAWPGRRGPAGRSAARSSKDRPIGPPGRSTGPPRTPARSCWSSPATPRWSRW